MHTASLPSCEGNECVIQVMSRSQGPTLPMGGQQEQRIPSDLSDSGVNQIIDVLQCFQSSGKSATLSCCLSHPMANVPSCWLPLHFKNKKHPLSNVRMMSLVTPSASAALGLCGHPGAVSCGVPKLCGYQGCHLLHEYLLVESGWACLHAQLIFPEPFYLQYGSKDKFYHPKGVWQVSQMSFR